MITTTTTCDKCGKVEIKKGAGGTLGSAPQASFIDVYSYAKNDGEEDMDLTFCDPHCLLNYMNDKYK